ncbi:efflux RND transporter periplasmic adaptor subunit [Spirosoma utsteinense]|uniref:Membrane fusion protein (Multidrug efflux system) n=1 Tax=Spirosoma utsteinense TaxID=2585773 RepID=A0ABR6VZA3_9BACT|nr:efflux RND transporter periplasmic adaptor subunit [Spirosoma utsteinense]MBC3784611.1 membrane fusion protein (multidrug efflux system) [Spirosoma utsteinense]MBC3789636.1 membrane fusion protein (multidrug efflux system) [Spirosoma utsteinense]
MKRWIAIGLVVLVLGGIIVYNKVLHPAPGAGPGGGEKGGGGKGGPPGATKGQTLSVNGFVVETQRLREDIVSSGSLLAAEQVDIYPEISARITQLNIQEGQPVTKGALLVKLFDADLRAQLQKLQAQADNARRTEDRNKQLLERGGISQQEYDIVTTNLRSSLADIELVKANLQRTEIRAPFSGVIGLRNVSNGAVVSPSTLIARLQQITSLKLDFSIPEKYGQSVRNGSKISFLVDGSSQPSQGVVYAIEPGVEEQTRNLRIRARINNTTAKFRPGTFARVTLTIQNEQSLVVPTQAVIPQTRTNQVILVKNGKAVFKDVKTGLRTAGSIQILSGVAEGDTVATTGLLFLKPDAAVKIGRVITLPNSNPKVATAN